MPPKAKFSADEIITAALNVIREKGSESISTREIAAILGVSTRPIFTYFKTMEEVKEQAHHAALKIFDEYAAAGLAMPIPFFGFGMQYIRFAKDEPELYKFLFLSSSKKCPQNVMSVMEHFQLMLRKPLMEIYNMDAKSADHYFRDLWLVVHSLATLTVTAGCPYNEEEISAILTEFSLSICKTSKEIPGFFDGNFDRDAIFQSLTKKQ